MLTTTWPSRSDGRIVVPEAARWKEEGEREGGAGFSTDCDQAKPSQATGRSRKKGNLAIGGEIYEAGVKGSRAWWTAWGARARNADSVVSDSNPIRTDLRKRCISVSGDTRCTQISGIRDNTEISLFRQVSILEISQNAS
jgi:hypothetical protein